MDKGVLFKSIIISILVGLLGGCAKPTNLCNYDLKYGSICSQAQEKQLQKLIRKRGIQISYLGDGIYVVVPSRQLFYAKTANLSAASISTLNLVAKFLACYQKITVSVIGFSNECDAKQANINFARSRAQRVAKELWRRGSNARLVYAKGRSAATDNDWGNRVEIITKRLP